MCCEIHFSHKKTFLRPLFKLCRILKANRNENTTYHVVLLFQVLSMLIDDYLHMSTEYLYHRK
jgi:hypothetical protein